LQVANIPFLINVYLS